MTRLEDISKQVYDVAIIGGGAHGATLAYHAAKEGFSTILFEKSDFCSSTSANSLKIIHGGLRYLQHGNVKRMRQSITARKEMMTIAPHLVSPLACLMPTHGNGVRGKVAMRIALFLNDLISHDRNKTLESPNVIPGGYTISEKRCREIVQGLNVENLSGAAVWYDVLAQNTERLILEYIFQAKDCGAHTLNYCEIQAIDKKINSLYALTAQDTLTDDTFLVQTRSVVNAAGPWFEKNLRCVGKSEKIQKWAVALNIVTNKALFKNHAVALEGTTEYEDKDALIKSGNRLYFFVPWRNHTMIGTEYLLSNDNPDSLSIVYEMIHNMVDNVNSIYPSAALTIDDISFYHAGKMPIQSGSTELSIQLEKNSSILDHSRDGYANIISIRGVKYTTAPFIAQKVVKLLKQKIEPTSFPQNECSFDDDEYSDIRNDQDEVYTLLLQRYGQRARHIMEYVSSYEKNDQWIDNERQYLKAEIDYFVRDEQAKKLADIVFRRTEIGTAAFPGYDVLEKISHHIGIELGWNKSMIEREIEEVVKRYSPLPVAEKKT